jgi:predicted oxidoreductase
MRAVGKQYQSPRRCRVKRYEEYIGVLADDLGFVADMNEAADGNWVRFEDAQAEIAAKDAEIAELKKDADRYRQSQIGRRDK